MTQTIKSLQEARRIVSKHEFGNRNAVVYKDPEWDEHQIEFYEDGKHQKDATSFESGDKDGRDAAKHTAEHWVKQAKISESTETKQFANLQERLLARLKSKMPILDEMMMDTARGSDIQMRQGTEPSAPQVHVVHKDKPTVPIKSGTPVQIHAHTLNPKSGFNPKVHRIVVGRVNQQGHIGESEEDFSEIEAQIVEEWGDGAKKIAGAATLAGILAVTPYDKSPQPSIISPKGEKHYIMVSRPSETHKPKSKFVVDGKSYDVYSGKRVYPSADK